MTKLINISKKEITTVEFTRQFTALSEAKANANANTFKQLWQGKLDELCLASIQER